MGPLMCEGVHAHSYETAMRVSQPHSMVSTAQSCKGHMYCSRQDQSEVSGDARPAAPCTQSPAGKSRRGPACAKMCALPGTGANPAGCRKSAEKAAASTAAQQGGQAACQGMVAEPCSGGGHNCREAGQQQAQQGCTSSHQGQERCHEGHREGEGCGAEGQRQTAVFFRLSIFGTIRPLIILMVSRGTMH